MSKLISKLKEYQVTLLGRSVPVLALVVIALVACCGCCGIVSILPTSEKTPTPTVADINITPTEISPTSTSESTNTPAPTDTPAPTNTPEPTDTPESTAAKDAYRAEIVEISTQYKNAFIEFSELAAAAGEDTSLFLDDDWKIEMVVVLVTVTLLNEEIRVVFTKPCLGILLPTN